MLLFCPSWSCTIICIIFTSLCKNLVKLTWVLAEAFRCHGHRFHLSQTDLNSYYEIWHWFDPRWEGTFLPVYGICVYSASWEIRVCRDISGLEIQQGLEISTWWSNVTTKLSGWSFISVFWPHGREASSCLEGPGPEWAALRWIIINCYPERWNSKNKVVPCSEGIIFGSFKDGFIISLNI